jgi:hypothetical protein
MTWKHTTRRWSLALALLALGALVLAGCGGSSGGSSAASTTTASDSGSTGGGSGPGGMEISDEAKACLKEKGVELPEVKGGEGGRPSMGEGGEPPAGGEPPQGGEMPAGGPAGEGGPGGEGFEKMQKAFEECGVETGGFKGGPGKGAPDLNSASFKKQIREYVACVRENGYELAEPNFSGDGPVFEKSESESAAFKKASAKCQRFVNG